MRIIINLLVMSIGDVIALQPQLVVDSERERNYILKKYFDAKEIRP